MGSFHDQYMDAWDELMEVERHGPNTIKSLRDLLHEARELIDEDNDFKTRQQGGQLIREVRQECRRLREDLAA